MLYACLKTTNVYYYYSKKTSKLVTISLVNENIFYISLQVTLKSEARGSLPEDNLKELKRHDHNLLGAEEEERLYNNLRAALTRVKNTIVINGWKENGSQGRAMREFDFLIVSESLQTIIHIEAKRSYSISSREKAAEQLKKGLDFALENLPFPIHESWMYTRVIYFGSDPSGNQYSFCPKCKLFVIDSKTNLNDWWINISKIFEASTKSVTSTSTYIMICKFLLHQMFQQGQCVTQNDIIKYTEETSDAIFITKNIIFWSSEQFSLINDAQNKRLFFISPYGTGKTTLIKAQAKELLEAKQRVVFVFFEEGGLTQQTLLQKTYQIEFPAATFYILKGSSNTC